MKQLGVALAAVGIIGQVVVCEAKGLAFEVIQPQIVMKPMTVEGVSRAALKQAVAVHNLLVEMHDIDFVRRQGQSAYMTTQLAQEKLNALEKCSVDKLAEQFKNPEEVWKKMKAEYEAREQDLAIYVNASTAVTPEQKKQQEQFMLQGIMTDDMVNETFASWRIGQEILMDVYQNQDKWGERKNANGPSFNLWEDQKYQFDQEWNDYYTKLNAFFGVPPEGRPAIGDEKYDYAKADKVKEAHDLYLKALAATAPNKLAAIPAALKQLPAAPRPLPPKQEMVLYFNSDIPEKQVYPALPEPWQKYAENGYKDINPKGEMADDFIGGLNMTENAKKERKTNRLVAYEALKQSVDSAQKVQGLVFQDINQRMQRLRGKLANFLSSVPPPEELLKEDVLEQVRVALEKKHADLVQEAKVELDKRVEINENQYQIDELKLEDIEDIAKLKEINPEAFEKIKSVAPISQYQQDTNILNALQRDPHGKAFINEVNATDVDRLMKEYDAGKAFLAEESDWDKEMARSASVKIDETCLNGGI